MCLSLSLKGMISAKEKEEERVEITRSQSLEPLARINIEHKPVCVSKGL